MQSRPVVSYAQNREDIILWRALRGVESGFYIDVGAAWPEEHSVTQLFSERGWRGVNIEPNPALHAALEAKRSRDINLQVALGEQDDHLEFHVFTDTGLSTFDDAIASRHRPHFSEQNVQVQIRTLRDVWSEHVPAGQEVHFLKIDVEGFERLVLLGADWDRQRPWIVVIESTFPLSPEQNYESWQEILINNRYRFVYFDGLNRFYLAEEHAELAKAFEAPPNFFDDYIPFELLRSSTEVGRLRQELGDTKLNAVAAVAERDASLNRLRVEVAEMRESAAEMRAGLERSVSELKRVQHDLRNASLSPKRKKSPLHKAVSDLVKKFNNATRDQRHRLRNKFREAPFAKVARTGLADSSPLKIAPVPDAQIAPALDAPTFYEDRARRHAPVPGVPAFPKSDSPALSFLINAADLSDDLSLTRTFASVTGQNADVWEVLIYGLPTDNNASSVFTSVAAGQNRVYLVEGADGGATGLSAALGQARGKFVAVLDAGDLLAPGVLNEIGAALTDNPDLDILYSDEDRNSDENFRDQPYLKPSWSPELLYAFNYFGRLTLLRRDLAIAAGGFDDSEGAAAEWGLNLRAADVAQVITRIPKILCHRRPGSVAGRPAPDTAAAADARRTIENYWRRHGFEAVATTSAEGWQSTTWPLAREPRVSIVIPTRDKAHLLRMAALGVLHQTDYQNLELIIVDTGSQEPATEELYQKLRADSRVRFVNYRSKFNYSSACNVGASAATGELLLFLSNDVEMISRDWLAEMVRVAQRPGVGCVGVKLVSPSLELQHAGVSIGPHLVTMVYRGCEGLGFELFGSPNHPRNWLATMGACQIVTREAFDAVGGFDESYRIGASDLALCLQLWRAGYRTAYVPASALVHHEGATRGHTNPEEDLQRWVDEIRSIGLDEDPYLHPGVNFDQGAPKLLNPGSETPRNALQRHIEQLGSVQLPSFDLDLVNDGRLIELAGLPRNRVLWPPQPAFKVVDAWSAARWTLDLLRRRPDIRARFPRALTDGWDGPFAQWVSSEGLREFGLPPDARKAFQAMFAANLGGRARRFFLHREDLRRLCPWGLTPVGLRELFRWLMEHGRREGQLRLEEIWWLFWEAREKPERELVRAYLLSPAWQIMFPDAASPFGADRFARWFGATHHIAESWLDPSRWEFPGSPADQIRLAWRARDDWRAAHPQALREKAAARALLDWLQSGQVAVEPWAMTWLRGLDRETIAEELARPGLNMIAHFRYPCGLRVSAEAMVEGLREIDARVSARDIRMDPNDDPGHERFAGMEIYDATVIHTQPGPVLDNVFRLADLAERTPRSYRIGYWYWEFDVIPDYWRQQAAQFDEVWAATEFVAKGLREKLTIPVHKLFPGVRLPAFEPRGRAHFNLPENETIFTFAYHMGSVMERKNPAGLVRAFKRAFRADEPARLVLKTTFGAGFPEQMEQLRELAAGARITIVDEVYTPNDILALIDACDVYVSLHRSEGLGLTMAEAMLLGKPVVATGYSGNVEFMDADNSLLVDYTLEKLDVPIPPYEAGMVWATPSEDHAAGLMRRLYENPDFRVTLGGKAKRDAEERLSVATAGQRILARLAEIDAQRAGASLPGRILNAQDFGAKLKG